MLQRWAVLTFYVQYGTQSSIISFNNINIGLDRRLRHYLIYNFFNYIDVGTFTDIGNIICTVLESFRSISQPMIDRNFSTLSGLTNASKRLQNSANNIANISKGSNVDIIEEIVDQIVSKVAIQANVNVIKTNDGTLGTILDIKS